MVEPKTLLSRLVLCMSLLGFMGAAPLQARNAGDKADSGPMKADSFAGLALRGIGPAMISGRIADLAVNPKDKSTWYVAAATGGLWKTDECRHDLESGLR